MAQWIAGLTGDEIPPDVVDIARLQVLNTLCAAMAGARSHESASVLPAVRALAAGAGRCSVVGTAERLGPVEAAVVNAAHSMAQDYDDIIWMGHTCHSAVFAPLAIAQHERLDARAFLTAVVVANEIAGRLGASSFLGPLNGQMWTFIHLVGAAAGTARLLGLDATRTQHALAIALSQPNFALQPAFMAPTSKLLTAATPTAAGIRAAYFARAGMTGAARILEDERGFWRRFAFVPLPGMLDGLGRVWALRTLSIKTFPGCFYFQTACTALQRIVARTGPIPRASVARVDVDTTKLGMEVTRFARDYLPPGDAVEPVNVNFDLGLTLAILLHAGELRSMHVEPGWLSANAPDLRAWRALIHVEHDPLLTAAVVRSARGMESGRRALRALGIAELARVSRRYREEYRSTLFSPADARKLLEAGRARLRRGGGSAAPVNPVPGRVPLLFPNRVRVRFVDGREELEQVDLPVGSVASPAMERELEAKWNCEVPPSVGVRASRHAWRVGRALGDTTLAELLRALSGR